MSERQSGEHKLDPVPRRQTEGGRDQLVGSAFMQFRAFIGPIAKRPRHNLQHRFSNISGHRLAVCGHG